MLPHRLAGGRPERRPERQQQRGDAGHGAAEPRPEDEVRDGDRRRGDDAGVELLVVDPRRIEPRRGHGERAARAVMGEAEPERLDRRQRERHDPGADRVGRHDVAAPRLREPVRHRERAGRAVPVRVAEGVEVEGVVLDDVEADERVRDRVADAERRPVHEVDDEAHNEQAGRDQGINQAARQAARPPDHGGRDPLRGHVRQTTRRPVRRPPLSPPAAGGQLLPAGSSITPISDCP